MPWVVLIFMMQGALCSEWSVWMPQRIPAVRGSCVLIPCRFEIPDEYKSDLTSSPSAIWRRGSMNGPYIFNSADHKTFTQGTLEGDLLQKNCTTKLQDFTGVNDTYFFRLEGPNPLKYNFNPGVQIIQTDTPPGPKLFPEMVLVPEGKEVVLSCSAPAPCPSLPPSLSWSIGGREQHSMNTPADGLLTLTSTLTFTASPSHHGSGVSCSVQYPLTTGGTTEKVQSSMTISVSEMKNKDIRSCSTLGLYILCGVMMSLCLLSLPLVVFTFRSLSRRLTQVELLLTNTNSIYTSLKMSSMSSDYDQLQAPRSSASVESPYENRVVQETRRGRPAP
ncbi:myelin-associated glycoprotein [Osmerus mordax]|uniref:myelin-associated glycoprotein n=1 Tax=Osmerus mordax TaxID=8014 RepID=UPI00350FC066